VAQHCPECGFANVEGANYCQRCGAFLTPAEPTSEASTAGYKIGETGDLEPVDLSQVTERGPALVIRSGGGRVGETFMLDKDRLTVGRRPDSDIFLDDVTVSRKHAVFTKDGDRWQLEDQGSLNGTFVNRERVETAELTDGDELQIGKYRLTFLQR
jgi:hypothetical protein